MGRVITSIQRLFESITRKEAFPPQLDANARVWSNRFELFRSAPIIALLLLLAVTVCLESFASPATASDHSFEKDLQNSLARSKAIVDVNSPSTCNNSDHAGTPQSFKSSVTGGQRGTLRLLNGEGICPQF